MDLGAIESKPDADLVRELGRILRYWGGNMEHFQLVPGDGSAVYDSAYTEVGRWSIVEDE